MSRSISYAHGTTLSPLIGETIGSNFDRVAGSYPERDALVVPHQDVRWSYRELARRVARLAGGLVAIGLRPGTAWEFGRPIARNGCSRSTPPPKLE
jgi:fatty-acyl-CoA synthase